MINVDYPCERDHGDGLLQSFIVHHKGKRQLVTKCSYIMGYRQSESSGSSTVMCGDLSVGKKLPNGFVSLGDVLV